MKRRLKIFWQKVLPVFLTLFSVTLFTVISMLYAKGYRINIGDFSNINLGPTPVSSIPISISKTGILAIRSVPDAAKIYINDKLVDTTNATVSSLIPGSYNVKVKKEGFETWEKQVEVYDDKVTDLTALLVLKGGGLNPITNSGVSQFQISNNGEVLAFITEGEAKPGLYTLQLSNSPINIFQSNKKAIAVDGDYIYSKAERIYWSPDDQQIMLKISDSVFCLLDLSRPANQQPVVLNNENQILLEWENKDLQNKITAFDALKIPAVYRDLAISKNSVWSPDGEKFYVVIKDTNSNDKFTVEAYNFEDPLPVGEVRVNKNVKFSGLETNVYWYSDSKHLLIVNKEKMRIVNIDGSNSFEVFSGDILGAKAAPSPYGDKIIILSSFKSQGQSNLYGVSIR